MRPWRIGISSGTRVSACSSSSGRSDLAAVVCGFQTACDERGHSERAARPRALRSDTVRCSTFAETTMVPLRRLPGRSYAEAEAQAGAPATTALVQSITDVGLTTWRWRPSSLGFEPEGEAEELGEVQDRQVQLAADDLLGQRLLEVEVEVAQRARRDEAVGLGVDGVAEVAAGLLERGLLVHRDDGEAAALVGAGVVDHRRRRAPR